MTIERKKNVHWETSNQGIGLWLRGKLLKELQGVGLFRVELLWAPVGKENCSNKLPRPLPRNLFGWVELNTSISRCS